MNFLFHYHLATRDLGARAAGVGAMLPDLWRMADRRVRPSRERHAHEDPIVHRLLDGVQHHLEVDRWFHAAEVFVEGERATGAALARVKAEAPKLGMFAHIIWEMCLDGELLRRVGLDALLRELSVEIDASRDASEEVATLHHFSRRDRSADDRATFSSRMRRIQDAIAEGPWIEGYLRGLGIAERAEGVRVRFGLGRFNDRDRAALGEAIEGLRPRAALGVDAILSRASVPGD